MKNNSSEVLYISIDGIMEPLGYSQVFKYLEGLSQNYAVNLISFEKKTDLENLERLNVLTKKCDDRNIHWRRLKYRSGFFGLGKLINICNLILAPIYIFITKKVCLVHIRSYMPGIAIPILKALFQFKLIFDMRGFWADEKHDRLHWSKKSLKYKFFKRLESYLLNISDHIVTLTNSSKNIIARSFNISPASIEVIPTCVDFNEFKRVENLSKYPPMIIGYLGSVDTAYDFPKFCFLVSQLQSHLGHAVNLKVLTNQSHDHVLQLIPRQLLNKIELEVKFVKREKLSQEISSFDLLGFYLKENFSINASMPTKIAETLACGIPIVCNGFNEDIKNILEKNDAGLIYNFNDDLTEEKLDKLVYLTQDPKTALRCLGIAEEYFSLEKGTSVYVNLYSKLIS
jgi:glycosyltransferase involved in cell wall biosynthesis